MSDGLKKTSKIIKALSDENRLRILSMLSGKKDLCVCEITAVIGLSQPTISSHLKILENAGLLEYKKEGLWVNYNISSSMDGETKRLVGSISALLAKSETIKKDLKRLMSIDRKKICSRKA